MSSSAKSQPGTGLQEAKSARARKAITDATIDSLAKNGYSDTSLALVAKAANYTKGALQHHFSSKEDLIAATLDTLLSRTMQPYINMQKPSSQKKSVEAGLMVAWDRHVNTPAYRALLEILNASRINRDLQKRISKELIAWGKRMDKQSLELYEAVDGDDEDVIMLLNMNRCFMRGLLLQELYGTNKDTSLRYLERWVEMIAPLVRLKK